MRRSKSFNVREDEVNKYYKKLKKDAEEHGYHLNPDVRFTKDLVRGLIINTKRYGYQACPCRLAFGIKEKDIDIICPCDYRDLDLNDYGACYCGLYVSEEIINGEKELKPVPERRGRVKEKNIRKNNKIKKNDLIERKPKYPLWRCKVCGYLCARENPPEVCPICKAKKERFELFDL